MYPHVTDVWGDFSEGSVAFYDSSILFVTLLGEKSLLTECGGVGITRKWGRTVISLCCLLSGSCERKGSAPARSCER